jgi:hypothetical protein
VVVMLMQKSKCKLEMMLVQKWKPLPEAMFVLQPKN